MLPVTLLLTVWGMGVDNIISSIWELVREDSGAYSRLKENLPFNKVPGD